MAAIAPRHVGGFSATANIELIALFGFMNKGPNTISLFMAAIAQGRLGSFSALANINIFIIFYVNNVRRLLGIHSVDLLEMVMD